MRAISFVWTSAPLLAGAKTVTRREWPERYATEWYVGQLAHAYDRRPSRGGKLLATIRLTARPTWEPMQQMPDSDYAGEGHEWLYERPEYAPLTIDGEEVTRETFSLHRFKAWRNREYSMWVVRFELVEIHRPTYLADLRAQLAEARARQQRRRVRTAAPVAEQGRLL